jgi:hypothetical protein
MGCLTSSQPSPPDPVATANAQTQSNKDTAVYQSGINNPNEVTPFGNVNYTWGGVDGAGRPIYTRTESLTPQAQQTLNEQLQQDVALSRTGSNMLGRVDQTFNQPIPGLNDYQDNIKQAQDSVYNRNLTYLDPQFTNRENALRVQLANQGIGVGSEAWAKEFDQLGRDKTLAYGDARNQAVQAGSNEQNRLIALALQLRSQPLNELNALRSSSQVQQPQFQSFAPTQVAGTDVAGIINANYAGQLQSAAAKQSGRNALIGAVGQLGGAAASFGLGGGFGRLFSGAAGASAAGASPSTGGRYI